MFALAEIYPSRESSSIRFFKPWWDLVIDYLNMGMLGLTLISFARLTLSDHTAMICVGTKKVYSWPEIKYINSRCSYTVAGCIMVYYPYIVFIQWVLLAIVHFGWLTHPNVFTKLDEFHKIFKEMCIIRPKYYRNPNTFQMASELTFDSHSQDKIEVLYYKLLYLLADDTFLVTVYKAKMIGLFILGLGSTGLVLTSLLVVKGFPLNFHCQLKASTFAKAYNDIHCNLEPAFFSYGAIFLNLALVVFTTLFALHGLVWLLRRGLLIPGDPTDVFGSMSEYYGGMPGFRDFQFCILLLQKNIRDGNVMFETIKACIKGQAKKFKQYNYSRRGTVDMSRSLVVPTRVLEESKTFVRWIADQLGLEEVPNSQNSNHLFDCITFIQDSLGLVNFNVQKSMREVIADEIESNPIQFKTMIDKHQDSQKYEDYVKALRNKTTFGKQYVLMAAAQLLHVRLVIIHCHPTKKVKEVFLPYKQNNQNLRPVPRTTRFLTFITPHFYHATVNLPVKPDWPTILTKRRMYATDSRFRADMRNAAVRCINSLNICHSARKINPDQVKHIEDVTTIEMPVMGVKRGR